VRPASITGSQPGRPARKQPASYAAQRLAGAQNVGIMDDPIKIGSK
jgi:hypothetical protein